MSETGFSSLINLILLNFGSELIYLRHLIGACDCASVLILCNSTK